MMDLEERVRTALLGVLCLSLAATFLAGVVALWVWLIRYAAGGCG